MVFCGTQLHGNADGLSRLPLSSTTSDLPMVPELMLLLEHLAESLVTASDIKKFTRCDPVLSQVLQFVMQGWPKFLYLLIHPAKLSYQHLMVAYRGVQEWLFHQCEQNVLQELYSAHPGMTKMKSLAQMYVWWPCLDTDIDKTVRSCNEC